MMRWLGYGLSFLSSSIAVASGESSNDSVLIIGGGMSGLAAALELEKLGYSTTLVEASSRLGGRVSSLSNGVELGGTYLHGSSSQLAYLIQHHYQLPTAVSGGASAHPGKNAAVWTYQGRILDKNVTEERSTALHKTWLENIQTSLQNYTSSTKEDETIQHLQATSEQVMNNLTFNSTLDRALLNFELQMGFQHDLGVPFSRVSVEGLYNNWDWIEHEGPDCVLTEGLESLIRAMQKEISGHILLNSPVERISYHSGTCTVTMKDGKQSLTSSACIVTIPLGVLKKHHKTLFDPPLPPQKQDALERAGVAAFNTLVLKWNKPLCQAGAYYPLYASNDNPLSSGFVCPQVLRSNATSSAITQFYISGEDHPFQNEQYWKSRAVEVINDVFVNATFSENDIVDWNITAWHEDPFIMGSYSTPTTGTRGNMNRQTLQDSLDNVVFFAGEHTHMCGRYQSLDGAYDTGVLAARQVAACLRQDDSFQEAQLKMTCEEQTPDAEMGR